MGAVRMVEVGAQRMFEKLIALDEDEHSMYGLVQIRK